jgi:oligoendopeptidase F
MLLFSMLLHSPAEVLSQSRERADIPQNEKWNLTHLYASDEAWAAHKDKVVKLFDKVTQFKGRLGKTSTDLLACLVVSSDLNKEFSKLYSYASMRSDEDTRNSTALGMKQQMAQLSSDFGAKTAFIEPEILEIDAATITQFLKEESGLIEYKFYLEDIQRRKAHMLSENEEKIIAQSGLMANAPYSIYSVFANAELPYPTVKLTDGQEVLVNNAGYSRYRAVPNRADREIVFKAFFSTLNKFRQTLGTQLDAAVKRDLFYTQARGYNTCLERALDANNIPASVYHSLIDNVNANLNTFHRYLQLKKRMLAVDTLKYSDLYAPVVKGIDLEYSLTEGQRAIAQSMKPLGDEYVKVLETAFKNRWIDYYPNTGKRSGAYSNGSAYDVHPYILMNYNGQYDDVSTLAHELGHTMQSYLSNKNQPYPTADYPIFVAEVASTFNEALLIQHELKKIKDDETRLSLLMNYLDGIKGTVFRQTQFAEFELRIHEMAEKGEPLTGDSLTKLYSDIVRKYYGHEQGICLVDDLYTVEWSYIPHFYYNYYVYQYATSFTASTALSQKVLTNEKGVKEKYIAFLSAGGSDYPINLLKTAGVDMTTADPFVKTMEAMNNTMDEIEKIISKMGK